MNKPVKLSIFDRALGAVYAPYKTKALAHREYQASITDRGARSSSPRRAGRGGRTDNADFRQQPWAIWGTRTYNSATRIDAVRKSRQIYENNILGRSMLDRATDNIIGEGMYVKADTGDAGFDAEVEAFWHDYDADDRGMVDKGTLQRWWFRNWKRDGDTGGILLRGGQVQTIESDLIQSPDGIGDTWARSGRPEVVDGVKLTKSGRPTHYYIQTLGVNDKLEWTQIPARNFLYIADTDRSDYTAVRGVPTLATIGWLLEQIDGVVEASVMAYRMAAMFGLVRKAQSPGKAIGNLPLRANSQGDNQAHLDLAPGSIGYIGMDEDLIQVKPEHPHTAYDQFMTSLVRFGALNFGLPLELAMLDFSKTNYSSARASMEQAYRAFRVQQNRFAHCWLSKWYRWRISKAVNEGVFGSNVPENYQKHKWFGQPWPYLNPVDDAQGRLALIDAGGTSLTEELAKRGMRVEEWLDMKAAENKAADDRGVTMVRSNLTRDVVNETQA